MVVLGEGVAGGDVAPEDAAVVDDPGDQLDVVANGGVEGHLAGPGLEGVEDDHRPVDAVAEALEAVDQVEGEAVGGTGGDPDPLGQAGLAKGSHAVPDLLGGVAGAVGVVEQEQVEGVDADPLEAALGGHAQVGGVIIGAAQARVGEAGEAARPLALAFVEVMPDGADQGIGVSR